MKHILYANNNFDAAQDALNAGTLENPYIAAVTSGSGIFIDYNTREQQSCEERGLCGDDPTNCHECTCEEQFSDPAEICACEGGYYWDGGCHDEPEPEEPCAGMEADITDCETRGGTWDYVNCMCNEPEPEDPCAGMEQEYEDCINGGGVWDAGTCTCQPADPCGGDPECECVAQGGEWDGENENCIMPSDEDPCAGYGSPEECECAQQGGTWSGSECQM